MAELAAALAALSGRPGSAVPESPSAAATPKLSPSMAAGWHVPPHLLRQPAIRSAAFAAHEAAREACAHPGD